MKIFKSLEILKSFFKVYSFEDWEENFSNLIEVHLKNDYEN